MIKQRVSTLSALVVLATLFSFIFVAVGSDAATLLDEGFEAGGKSGYAAANVTLGSGSWYINDALTGNLSTDRKTGLYSARVRNSGSAAVPEIAPPF